MEGLIPPGEIMSEASPKSSSVSRFGIAVNVLVQSALVVFLVGVANYIGFNYYQRWDFSRSQKFALAEQTKRVLKTLKQPAKITLFGSPTALSLEASLHGDIDNLLKEYRFTGRDRIEVDRVDPARDLARAREIEERTKVGGAENVLIVEYDGRTKVIPVADMGEFDLSGLEVGNPARIAAFRGEEVLTSALLGMLNPEQKVIYALQGHGEILQRDMAYLSDFIARQNAVIKPLNLGMVEDVPADAGALFLAGPRYDLTEGEIALLEDYAKANGGIVAALNPDAATPRLNAFLAKNAIVARDDRVLSLVPSRFNPNLFGIGRDIYGIFLPTSKITKRLEGTNGFFPTASKSLRPDERLAAKDGIQLRPLVAAPEQFWGETNYQNVLKGLKYDDGRDTGQPVYLAIAAERGGVSDDRLEVTSAKLVVVGNSAFVADSVIRNSPANLDFLLNVMNWMLDRSDVAGVAPKTVQTFNLSLSDDQMSRIALYTLVVIPGAVALMGIVVGWRRRA